MTTTTNEDTAGGREPRTTPRRRITSLEVLCAILLIALLGQKQLMQVLDVPALRTGATVFVAVCVQALPFLVLGVVLSGAIAAFVSPALLRRLLPRNTAASVPVAGVAGIALPGCECASVPIARRLMQQGVPQGAALAFLLAAPAVNPVVLVATAVAFPGRPELVAARFAGSLLTAIGMGWIWARFGRAEWMAERVLRKADADPAASRWAVFAETARHDLVGAGGFLVIGGLTAAVFNVVVPQSWLISLGGHLVLAVVVLSLLAVVLALCSQADAFVAASMSALPLLPRLVFLVVGPAVDVKLIALYGGTFGRRFVVRFAPVAFLVAIVAGVGTGLVFLGGAR